VISLSRPEFDLTRPETFDRIPSDTEVVVHAAGHVGETHDEALLWKANVVATYHLISHLNHCERMHTVVYLSSGAVYGMQEGELTCDSPLGPTGLYGVSKMLSERMIETLLLARPVILRLFFPFGPGQRPPRLIPRLIQQVARNETVEINTVTGRPVINPIFISELVEGIGRILHSPRRTFYNLGGPVRLSVREIVEAVARRLGVEPRLRVREGKTGNLFCRSDVDLPGDFDTQLEETIERADYL